MNLSDSDSATPAPFSRLQRVGDLLLDKGLITDDQVEQALAHQRGYGYGYGYGYGHKKILG